MRNYQKEATEILRWLRKKENIRMPTAATTPAKKAPITMVSDSTLIMRGRKSLMKANGLGGKPRSPLTQQLLETLNHAESYVVIPITKSRPKATTVFNLKDKAKRAGVNLHWVLAEDGKAICAWFSKLTGSGEANGEKGKAKVGAKIKAGSGPKALATPDAVALPA